MTDVQARIDAYVARLLAIAPPLTTEQRACIAAVFAATPRRVARRMGVAA